MNVKDFKIGQKIYRDIYNRQEGEWLTVEKIGRIWLTMTDGTRVNAVDMKVDNQGIGWVDQCYLTDKIWADEKLKRLIWGKIWNHIEYQAPGVSLDDTKVIARMMNLDMEGEQNDET